jgi:hypothetical protein
MGTPEEDAQLRADVIKEMDAEDSGEQSVDATPDEPKKVDPWEGVNPALKQAFDEMSNRVVSFQATEQRLRQAESRIGAITQELHTVKAVKETPTAAQMAAATESDEKWESLKQDFPDWAEAFDSRFDKKLTARIADLRTELKAEVKTEAPNVDLEDRLLTLFKPKWKETVATEEWREWLAMQPPETAVLVKSDKADDALSLLNAFEESREGMKTATEIAAERKRRLKTSELPKGGKATPLKSEADMSPSELRANIGKEVYADL